MIGLTDYNWDEIKHKIINYSKEIKIDKIGFTTAEPFYSIEKRLKEYLQKGYSSGFEEQDINLRIDPQRSLPSARSIIAIVVAYPHLEPTGIELKGNRGKFCRASWGQDYHLVLKEKLAMLTEYITSLVPGTETLAMVDTGPLPDRAVAVRAGLGWIGKNSSLITPEYGSFVYLGQLLTNLPLPPDEIIKRECVNCDKCVKACPMEAILQEDKTINCQKCLAYQTLTKGHLDDEIKEKIAKHNYIYGCDICQLACPYNQDKLNNWHQEFTPRPELVNPLLEELLKISNREFKKMYGNMSGSWRGKKNIQRNAILILGKTKDQSTIPLLKQVLFSDPRPEIRGAAAWAIGKFDLQSTREILKESLKRENDKQVIKEIKKAIKESQI